MIRISSPVEHHTVAANLSGPDFLKRKEAILRTLDEMITYGDMDAYAAIRNSKRTLYNSISSITGTLCCFF